MDLRPVTVSTSPGGMNEVLPETYSPVIVHFDTEMVKTDAQGAVQVSSGEGSVEGDFSWEGNRLFFIPPSGWKPGTRYTLSLSGTVYAQDGRELRLDRHIPFYALSRSDPPVVESFFPPDGASVEIPAWGAGITELRFSRPMDKTSTETAFTMEGLGERSFEWADDDRLLTIRGEKTLAPWTTYRWTMGAKAQSRDGVPLAKTVSAQFCTDAGRLFPQAPRVFPAIRSGPRWLPAGEDLSGGLGPGQGIIIEFNKPMGENLFKLIRFDPSLAGRTEKISESAAVFIPDRDPEPEAVYTLIIPGEVQDAGGLRMGADYTLVFRADIPWLRIISFTADGVAPLEPEASGGGSLGGPLAAPVDLAGGGVFRFTIRFSLPFTEEAKKDTALRITLSPFFPGTLEPIALRSVIWLSDDRLRMDWEGVTPGVFGEAHYYKLEIPGGKGGIESGGGMYLRENRFLYLEAVN
ncbi:MAG: Ig-like domain-containing protein [Treponema sp.]|nr:Ig-like domain-containing protein [Treponema sp.]